MWKTIWFWWANMEKWNSVLGWVSFLSSIWINRLYQMINWDVHVAGSTLLTHLSKLNKQFPSGVKVSRLGSASLLQSPYSYYKKAAYLLGRRSWHGKEVKDRCSDSVTRRKLTPAARWEREWDRFALIHLPPPLAPYSHSRFGPFLC